MHIFFVSNSAVYVDEGTKIFLFLGEGHPAAPVVKPHYVANIIWASNLQSYSRDGRISYNCDFSTIFFNGRWRNTSKMDWILFVKRVEMEQEIYKTEHLESRPTYWLPKYCKNFTRALSLLSTRLSKCQQERSQIQNRVFCIF